MFEYVVLIFIVICMYSISLWDRGREDFESGKTMNVEDIYEDLYANIYMPLWHSSKETNELFKNLGKFESTLNHYALSDAKVQGKFYVGLLKKLNAI